MMANAVRMARRGLGQTAPNPSVGAVIANDDTGEIIARGWTQPGGRPHAEAHSIRLAHDRARGATMYVTLEPCAHHGQTPPCAETIAAAGLKRVVVGISDPDPRTAGKGLLRLQNAGIEVKQGVLVDVCRWLTLGHILRITENRPFVQLKLALDANGEIARGANGQASWVTGAEARAQGHMLRAMTDAVLVGVQTVIDDDPQLTCRLPGLSGRSPVRVVLDSRMRTPATAKLLPVRSDFAPTWIASGVTDDEAVRSPLAAAGARVLTGIGQPRIDVRSLLRTLASEGITRVLVEGGPNIWQSFIERGVVDEAIVFRADTRRATAGPDAIHARWLATSALTLADRRQIGEDEMFTFRRS